MKISRLLRSKNIRNSMWIVGDQVFRVLINMVVNVLSARYLGPSGYGLLSYTASFVSFSLSIAGLSMDGVILKRMIQEPEREGEYLGSCAFFRLIASVLTIISITVIVGALNPGEPLTWMLAFFQSLELLFLPLLILEAWFQRHLRSRFVSVGRVLASLAVSSYKIFLLATGKSILWFAFSELFVNMILSGVLFYFYRKEHGQPLRVSRGAGMKVLAESYHYILSNLMVSIYTQMDKIMIGQMLTDKDVGLYTTAIAVCGTWVFIPKSIVTSFRPTIMELKSSGDEEMYRLRLSQLYSAIIWMCIAASVVMCIFGKLVIQILYGEQFIGALEPLRIAIWFETFALIGTLRGIWILCEDKSRYVKYYLGIGAVVNLILNAVLIPRIGIAGAAWATLVTQIVTSMVSPLFFKGTRIHTKIVCEAFVLKWYWDARRKACRK